MLRKDTMPRADRLQRDLFFCLCTRTARIVDGGEKRCRMSRLPERSCILRKVGTGIRSSSSTNSHPTSVDGRPSFAISPAAIVALPITQGAIRRAMFPEDAALYGWEFAVDDIAAVMRGLSIERAHLVGLSMGGYAALQFGLRYPEKASAIIAAAVGSGSHPSQRDAWLRETSVLARIFSDRGMDGIAERMARGPTRIQLKNKDPKSWQEFVARLRRTSRRGACRTRWRAVRPCGRRCMICAINSRK